MNFELGKVHSNPFARAFKPQPIVEVDGEDHEVKMAEGQLDYIIKAANELKQKLGGMEKNIPGWIQDHISKSHSYLHQANSGYHELGETKKSMKLTSLLSLNEDANMNKKVKALLDKSLSGTKAGSPPHLFAIKHILIGALTDANFHPEAKKVPALFPKAEFEPKTYGENEKEAIKMFEYEIGTHIARICGYDGGDIVDAIGFYASMTIGRPVGEKIQKLVEMVKENTEPPTITQLRDIVKNKQYKMVKDPKTGKSLGIDMQTANAVLQIYDGLSNVNKENMIKMGLPKMMDVSFKILNKYKK